MIKKIKKYFTDKPSNNFWRDAFITLFLFRYVARNLLLMLIPFRISLLSPDTMVNYTAISNNVATSIVAPMERLNEAGINMAVNNPIMANVLEGLLGYFIYIVYFMMFFLIINLLRYTTSWIYSRLSSKDTKTSEAKK